MYHLTTAQVQSEFKMKILGQNRVYGEDLGFLTQKIIWEILLLEAFSEYMNFSMESNQEISM
jgi:hypothetical protein